MNYQLYYFNFYINKSCIIISYILLFFSISLISCDKFDKKSYIFIFNFYFQSYFNYYLYNYLLLYKILILLIINISFSISILHFQFNHISNIFIESILKLHWNIYHMISEVFTWFYYLNILIHFFDNLIKFTFFSLIPRLLILGLFVCVLASLSIEIVLAAADRRNVCNFFFRLFVIY